MRLRQIDAAVEDFDQAILHNPDYAQAYLSRGTAHYNMGNFELALKDLTDAITLDTDIGYFGRSLALTRMGRDEEASQDLERAVESGLDQTTLAGLIQEIKAQR